MRTAAALIREDIALHRAELDELTTSLVEWGLAFGLMAKVGRMRR